MRREKPVGNQQEMGAGTARLGAPTMAPIIPNFPPCTAPAHNQNSKAVAAAWATARPAWAQTGFQLLELSHVCTLRGDRPGRTV
ncbi:hypothetical protein AVS7_00770 [Acidovorax sp. MR-S7]|nr:hypothetical protein AVS7_00770 [Acidovorax sp. MR-S7]